MKSQSNLFASNSNISTPPFFIDFLVSSLRFLLTLESPRSPHPHPFITQPITNPIETKIAYQSLILKKLNFHPKFFFFFEFKYIAF